MNHHTALLSSLLQSLPTLAVQLQLLDLPAELLHRCLFFLDVLDLLNCRQINRLFNNIIQQSAALQYTIELFAACAEDNPSCALHVSEKLERLRRRQDSWSRFVRHRTLSVDVQHAMSGMYDFTGGVYILGEAGMETSFSTIALKYICLPSLDDLEAGKESNLPWHSMELTNAILDTGTAIEEHDLIAPVGQRTANNNTPRTREIFIELIQFSTGQPHPLACMPMFTVVHEKEVLGHASVEIAIVGDLLALLLTFPLSPTHVTDDRLFVYNWKTATELIVHTADPRTYTTFTFISPTVLVMPNNDLATLELFDLSAAGSDKPLIPVQLQLPPLRARSHILRTECASEPSPASPCPDRCSSQPFRESAENAVIIFHFLIHQEPLGNAVVPVSCIVHRRTLYEWFRRRRDSQSGTTVIRWPFWGPPGTRWFDTSEVEMQWTRTISGQRFASIREDRPSRISIMDFNRYKVRRMMTDGKVLPRTEEATVWLNCLPTWLPEDMGVFESPVESRLPYVETVSHRKVRYDGILIDGERIIGICVSAVAYKNGVVAVLMVCIRMMRRMSILGSSILSIWAEGCMLSLILLAKF
ncbi:hypothetical protein OE88DRAFT_1625482 [Heliocybe sulcata]|uniref:F-box domain-containing protein n=1 Tax=Heliocybe sulcata TaxID=5364 RepID=A0A5C3N7T8_9AGAM|nr:hypothetical protein OE88DRAFT_1625482 [Heliocybe sulcata]